MQRICVIYLARKVNGIAPFEQFFDSYRRYAAGVEHDLAVVFKGFTRDSEIEPYNQPIAKLGAKSLQVSDYGFDIRAYYKATQKFENPYLCFFNSFSEILAENWLQKLYAAISSPGIGLAGATASAESMYTNVLIQRSRGTNSFLTRCWLPIRLKLCQACFVPFPNYHLRSNALIISRANLLKVWPPRALTKRGAYLFENGKNNLTRRIEGLNLEAVIVGRDGKAYRKTEWRQSRTFRLANQENLLVADNQTRQYDKADPETRKHLSRVAWGE